MTGIASLLRSFLLPSLAVSMLLLIVLLPQYCSAFATITLPAAAPVAITAASWPSSLSNVCCGRSSTISSHSRLCMSTMSSFNTNDVTNKLMNAIESGVGSGYYVNSKEDKEDILRAVCDVERLMVSPDDHVKFERDLPELNGRWKLLFTSNLLGLAKITSPLRLDEVFQVIDTSEQTVTNVVYGTAKPPLLAEAVDFLPLPDVIKRTAENVNDKLSFKVDFALEHLYTITSNEFPAQLKIVIQKVRLINAERGSRSLILPTLKPLAQFGAGRFDTTYMKGGLRISRGRFDEVRVFTKVLDPSTQYSERAAAVTDVSEEDVDIDFDDADDTL